MSAGKKTADPPKRTAHSRPRWASIRYDRAFHATLVCLALGYAGLILLMLFADIAYTSPGDFFAAFASPEIRFAAVLSLCTSTITAVLCVWIGVPAAYMLSRLRPAGGRKQPPLVRCFWSLLDLVFDLPIVLPPLVVGVSLLILFKQAPFAGIANWVVYEIPAIVVAQFTVACAFCVRSMRATFDQISTREEQIALTLGASRAAAFWRVLLPRAKPGLLAAATMSWARALGEFGPVLVFASSTRMRTEVLPTTVYLEIQAGNLKSALAVSMILVAMAAVALILARWSLGASGPSASTG